MKQIAKAILDDNKKPHCPYCNAGYEVSQQVDYGLVVDRKGNTYFEFVRKCRNCSKDNEERLYKYYEENLGDKKKVELSDVEEVKCSVNKNQAD